MAQKSIKMSKKPVLAHFASQNVFFGHSHDFCGHFSGGSKRHFSDFKMHFKGFRGSGAMQGDRASATVPPVLLILRK